MCHRSAKRASGVALRARRQLSNRTTAGICVESVFRPAGYTVVGCVAMPDVSVGSGARILEGVHVGGRCVVGTSAVVTKSFGAYSIVAGNPTVVVGRIDQSEVR